MEVTAGKRQLTAIFKENDFILDFNLISEKAQDKGVFSQEGDLYRFYQQSPDRMFFSLGFIEDPSGLSPSMRFLTMVSARFLERLARTIGLEYSREHTIVTPTDNDIKLLLGQVPFVTGEEFITADWIRTGFKRLLQIFKAEIIDYKGSVAEYLRQRNIRIAVYGQVFFHLVENKDDEDYPFAFLATYSTGSRKDHKASHTPLKNALIEYKEREDLLLKLLSTVSSVAEQSDFISELVESGELFNPLRFTCDEAYTFLKEVPLYEQCGILCRIPDWWKRSGSLRLNINFGEREPAKVGMDALLNFNPQLYFGDERVDEEELKAILAQTTGLRLIKGKWVEVDQAKLQAILTAYRKAQHLAEKGTYTIAEAMRLQLGLGDFLDSYGDIAEIEISEGKWLKEKIARLTAPQTLERVIPGCDFKAELRGYQQDGLNWLRLMQDLGFGACLADDMGLGKTVQVLALLEHMHSTGRCKTLLIIPASLISNWQREIERFTPKLRYYIIYSTKDTFDFLDFEGDLVITTYGLSTRLEGLKEANWDLIILDEAQAIKNPGTKQTRAIKKLKAKSRIALTGTPIENRLMDLWSLFDFLNCGLLGSATEFKKINKRLSNGDLDYSQFRHVISPFILRRLKTDKTIIRDLPDKIEMKAYTNLSKKQVALYSALTKELKKSLETAKGINRKGLVLASIIKAKQICNHPDLYLGLGEYQESQSGKFLRLKEICLTIAEKRERVLVFTQFQEMTKPLADFLSNVFGREGLVLHGQTPVKKRGELVDIFCRKEYIPFMILSLKAGGVGLNLTTANHVVHFDRWWNPAVENQATDRAFRIGQDKNVVVHKFVTSGTIEEKIDKMIEDKNRLAQDVLAKAGESWITELSNEELMDLFVFSGAGEKNVSL